MSSICRWMSSAVVAVAVIASQAVMAAVEAPITVILVRHAEKAADSRDPSLTAAGRERAEALSALLADAGITAIFSSEYKRTQETAEPLAKRLGLSVTTVKAKEQASLLAKVRRLPPGSRALVVGHSDTVPSLTFRMTGTRVPELTDADYDRLYIGTVPSRGDGQVVILHYGAPGAPPAAQ